MTEDHRVVQSHRAADSSALKSPSSWHHLALCSLEGQCLQVVGNLQVSDIDPEQNFKKTANEGGNSEAHKGQELQNIVCVERWM